MSDEQQPLIEMSSAIYTDTAIAKPEGEEKNGQCDDVEKNDHINQPSSPPAEPENVPSKNDDSQHIKSEKQDVNSSKSEHENSRNVLNIIKSQDASMPESIDMLINLLVKEHEHLSSLPLKDYSRLQQLRQATEASNIICSRIEDELSRLNSYVAKVNKTLNNLKLTVDKKIAKEGLLLWTEQLKTDPADHEAVAKEKMILAEISDAKLQLAEATKTVPKVEARLLELAVKAKEASADAQKARQLAEEAHRAAERAKAAEEKKRQQEVEAKKREEEERKRKEEEERSSREEEERKKRDKEKLAGTDEERERHKLEAEKRNPKNWPAWVYSVDPSNTGIPIGCIIRAMPGTTNRDNLIVERIDQLAARLQLHHNEELVSNIIKISQKDDKFKAAEPLSIAIPQIAQRNPSRECIIKKLQDDGTWIELPTNEVTFEDIKEFKFVECSLQKCATLAVIYRIKQESHIVHKRGGKVVASVDSRVCFTFRQSMFKVSTTVAVEVCPVDSNLTADVKHRKPGCENLITSSPVIRLKTPLKKYSKPVMVNVPLPPNPNKIRLRPATAVAAKQSTTNSTISRPKSAYQATKQDEEEEEKVHLLTLDNEGRWSVVDNMQLVCPKNKDVVTFEMAKPMDKFVLLRTNQNATLAGTEKMVKYIEEAMGERHVQVILRQKNDNENDILVQCCLATKTDEVLRKLLDMGYEYGPAPSNNIITHEGQPLQITFRGNITSDDSVKFVFNSHIKSRSNFTVKVLDTFAQKGIECYRGFAQVNILTTALQCEAFTENSPETNYVNKSRVVAEQLINLTKPEPDITKTIITRAPFEVKSKGLVNKDMLQQLASELGEEWKRLAQYLNIRRVRIQAILRNNADKDMEHVIYEMLLTWIKRIPKSANKVELLCSALIACGRVDLAEVMKDNESDFKKEQSRSARDSYLRKAFVKIAQSEHVVSDWKYLGRQLGLQEAELQEVEDSFTGIREKCFHSLMKWREEKKDSATPAILINTLKRCKYVHVSEQVGDILKDAV